MIEICKSISDVVTNIDEIITQENGNHPECDAEYFFRGESQNYGQDVGLLSSFQSSLDRRGLVAFEREIYNDALRYNIADFREDSTMAERVARMQHYYLPTRFADVSENALCALYFAVSRGYGPNAEADAKKDGYVRVLKVAHHKMKQFNSDIIIAISHLPLVRMEQINFSAGVDGVDYLRYEVTNTRPGFREDADDEIKERLIRELQQVWAFRPIFNNRRLISQSGLFLAFGCGDHKSSLRPTFDPRDYDDELSPSYGIKQVNYVRIAASAKDRILNELRHYGMMAETVYPELASVNGVLTKKYEERSSVNEF